MIASAIKKKGFRDALEYDLKKEQSALSTRICSAADRAAEFGEIRKLRPNLE